MWDVVSHGVTPVNQVIQTKTKGRSTIATSIVYSKLDYCNSLYYKLPKSQLSRLQHIQNSLARSCTVVKAPKSCHITAILRFLHCLRITECIEYKLLSLTYKVLTTTQPPYLHNLISIQRPRSTRSSSVVTLAWPPASSTLKMADRSFWYASPCLCNKTISSSTSVWYQFFHFRLTYSCTHHAFFCFTTLYISNSISHSWLKTCLFHKSYPAPPL